MPETSTVLIERGDVATLREHAVNLVVDHYEEVSLEKGAHKLSPDWERCDLLEKAGMLFVVCAWSDSNLVGYSVNLLSRHMHYDFVACQNDALFLSRAVRAGGVGLRLIRATENIAKQEGASRMAWHAKDGSALHRILREHYTLQDLIFTRAL